MNTSLYDAKKEIKYPVGDKEKTVWPSIKSQYYANVDDNCSTSTYAKTTNFV